MANDIRVKVKLDDKGYKKGLDDFEDDSRKSAKKAGRSVESSFTKRAIPAIKSMLPAIAAVGTALVTAFAGRRAIAAAAQQERAVESLNQSLRSAGTFSREASQGFQELASELQANTVFGDEVILQQAALARNFTRTNEEAEKLIKAATELSAATGETLEFGIRNLGKTFGGLTGELGETLPQLKGLSTEALRSGQALDFVLERFAGSAQAQTRTFSGGVQQLGNLFGDLSEAVGEFVVQSPAIRAIFGVIRDNLIASIKSVDQFRNSSGDFLKPLIQTSIVFGRAFNEFVIGPIELFFRFVKIGSLGVLTAIQEVFNAFLQTFGFVGEKLAQLFGKELPKGLRQFAKDSQMAADTFRNAFVESAEGGLTDELDITTSVDGFLRDIERAVDQSGPLLEQLDTNFENSAKKAEKSATQIGQSMTSTLAGGISKGIQSVTNALIQGGNAFEAFAGAVLNTFGDLSIQLGQFFIAQGLAQLALRSLDPTGSIAAGAGLIALGTLMKSFFAKGEGGGKGVVPETGQEGGGITGGEVSTPSQAAAVQQPEQEERGPQVAVNIQGDVLDSDETGTRIVKMINDAFDQEGAVIRGGAVS